MRDSFVSARNYLYAKKALFWSVLALILYVWHDPGVVPNGGTRLGYFLGAFSFFLMVWLMWLGVRKRRYRRGGQPLRYMLSGHIYLGTALGLIVTLHTGFQFGFNLHTIAYILLMLVLLSGFYGVYAYLSYPKLVTDNLNNQSRPTLLKQVEQLDEECGKLAEKIGSGSASAISRLISSTQIGGGVKEQMSERMKRTGVPSEINELFDKIKTAERRERVSDIIGTVNLGRALLADAGQHKTEQMHKLIDLLAQRKQLLDQIEWDIRYKSRMDIWLYVHVPLAFAAVAAVIAHIISVFFYW